MRKLFYEKMFFAVALTFIGGAMDTYTFLHYRAFPVAQSGNTILALANIYTQHYDQAVKKIIAVLCFFGGVIVARLLKYQLAQIRGWEVGILFFEAVIFFGIGFPMLYNHPNIVISIIAFTVSLQWVFFNTIEGKPYVNLYASGNIKGIGINLVDYLKNPQAKTLCQLKFFMKLVVAFISGAFLSLLFYQRFHVAACFFISLLFFCLAVKALFDHFKKNNV